MPLLSPSGGLIYHARARRCSKTIWRPFREAIEIWLDEWQPSTKGLLLIGPSGGYTLPTEWLKRFDQIAAVDFDPLAPVFFTRRHRLRSVRWIRENVLPTSPEGIDFAPLRRLLAEHANHAVLFSNVLGQLALDAPNEDAVERDLGQLRSILQGRHWASYHDRLSADRKPALPSDRKHRNDQELAALAFGAGEVSSHSTERLAQGLECETFAWEISSGYWHLIEGCRGASGQGKDEDHDENSSYV